MSLLHRSKSKAEPGTPKPVPPNVVAEPSEPAEAPEPVVELPTVWSSGLDDGDPRIVERREDGQIVVRIEIPGLDPYQGVEVTVADGILRMVSEHCLALEVCGPDGESPYRVRWADTAHESLFCRGPVRSLRTGIASP